MRAIPLLLLLGGRAFSHQMTSPPATFTISSYTALVLATSPEVQSARQAYVSADAAFKGQFAAMTLPTVRSQAFAYPYGYNPGNGYRFNAWRLNAGDWSENTSFNINIFNSFQDAEKTRSLRLARDSASRAYAAARENRAFSAIQAFYDLNGKQALTAVARQNLAAQDDQYQQSLDLYRNGMKSLADLLKSETDWRSSQLRLLTAENDQAKALLAFNVLIDRPGLSPGTAEAELSPGTTALPEVEADVSRALDARPEILGARKDVERAGVGVTQAWQGLLPNVRVDATWNHQDIESNVSASQLGIPNPNYYVGITASLPFGFNIGTQIFSLISAKAQWREAQRALQSQERQARLDVYAAYLQLKRDSEAYGVALAKEDIARRTLDLVASQYREGAADAIRMNQAQTDLLDAQVERTQDLHQLFIDRAQYKRAVGDPLW